MVALCSVNGPTSSRRTLAFHFGLLVSRSSALWPNDDPIGKTLIGTDVRTDRFCETEPNPLAETVS